MKKKLTLLFFFLTFLTQNILASSSQVDIIEVAPGIFVHQGKHFDVDENYQGDIGNIGFIIGKNSVERGPATIFASPLLIFSNASLFCFGVSFE